MLIQKWRPVFERVIFKIKTRQVLINLLIYFFKIWKQLDHDHDGEIPLGEIRALLNNVAESSIPPKVIDEIIKRADYDHNG